MTANAWWTSFYNWTMVVYTVDTSPFCFLFTTLFMHVRALVILDGGVSAFCVLDLVLCAGAAVVFIGLCIFFRILCLAAVYCSTLGTTGVDIVDNCWVGRVIYLV